ncbi:AraC family transcriptional regulator [Spirosoma validum]|uniref:AraC family transcriptional regulator n=1 Tax=Spirosoma validum TaxID=2771355 RepID=A0A927B8Z4_9BACT|nr:AraC family transcriptional regulator [Spirosoma validum]MBD2757468.1 AraC family transcriptional regulator [Spirosoma validum]
MELLLPAQMTDSALPITSLEANFPQLLPQLAACLKQNQPQQAVLCLEAALLQQVQQRLPLQQRRAQLLKHLLNQAQLPSPATLADQFALSIRQVERLVKTASGTTAKVLTRLTRFESARNQLWHQPDSNLTRLAYELGYADQAHFSRDFRAFSGRSPRAFVKQVRQWQQ